MPACYWPHACVPCKCSNVHNSEKHSCSVLSASWPVTTSVCTTLPVAQHAVLETASDQPAGSSMPAGLIHSQLQLMPRPSSYNSRHGHGKRRWQQPQPPGRRRLVRDAASSRTAHHAPHERGNSGENLSRHTIVGPAAAGAAERGSSRAPRQTRERDIPGGASRPAPPAAHLSLAKSLGAACGRQCAR